MNTMKWLVKREFWEHTGGFFWAPAIVGGLWTLLICGTLLVTMATHSQHGLMIDGESVNHLTHTMTPDEKAQLVEGVANGYMGMAAPLYIVLSFVVFFFGLGSLFDDRKDRSVLFWKSLPISDNETVLSKLAMALVVGPVITIALGTAVSLLCLFVLTLAAAAMGVNLFGILGHSQLYLSPFEVLGMLPIYMLWALPTIGWLMMVSAWARTKPFLWAVGVPVLSGILLLWFNAIFGFGWNIGWFWRHIVARGLLSVVPGSWFVNTPAQDVGETVIHTANGMSIHQHNDNMGDLMVQSWNVLTTTNLWIGVAIGAAMIYTAIRLRRWRDEG